MIAPIDFTEPSCEHCGLPLDVHGRGRRGDTVLVIYLPCACEKEKKVLAMNLRGE